MTPRPENGPQARRQAIVELTTIASRPSPLAGFLDRAPALLAQAFDAPVASLFLLDADGETIVLRGNVGFDAPALGHVRMRVGEGLTGLAIADKRPISVAHAPSHDLFIGFPEIDHDLYPVFAAAPVMGSKGPIGGVVIQRGKDPFSSMELDLLMALTAAIYAALRQAELIGALKRARPGQKGADGSRRVLLTGTPVIAGRTLGALAMVRRPTAKTLRSKTKTTDKQIQNTFTRARRALELLQDRAAKSETRVDPAIFATYLLFVRDGRLRGRALELTDAGVPLGEAFAQVAREVARAAVETDSDPFLQQRARKLEDFCDALAMLAAGASTKDQYPQKAIVTADRLSIYEVLFTAGRRPVAVVLSEKGNEPDTLDMVRLLGVPAVTETKGLFRWASEGDVALIDADHGYVHLNPSRMEVSEHKAWRKKQKLPPAAAQR